MDMVTLLIATVVLLVIYGLFLRSNSSLPPFPTRRLPIVGNLLFLNPDTRTLFKTWRENVGDIFSLYMGGTLVVVLNSYDLVKEALVTNGDVCSDRPTLFLDLATGIPVKGIFLASGEYWKEQRSVIRGIMRNFGMGTNVLAEKVMDERTLFTEQLASFKGRSTDIQILLYISVSNIICSILIGQRFEYDDKEFQSLMFALRTLLTDQQSVSLVNFMPWLQYLPGDIFKAKKIISNSQNLMSILTMYVERKRRDVADITSIDNFIDAYIIEKNMQEKAGVATFLDLDSLKKIMLELFEAGTETSSTTIYWCVLYMIVHPDIQEKVYQEIKDTVGTSRAPTMQDKTQIIYLNAVIHETQRLASVVPLSIMHKCSEKVTLRGFTLPKGTCIIPNLDSVLHDKTTWGSDVMDFRPERFIDDNGKLKVPEQFIPFGIGPRVCLAESLAKMELFLFLSIMFQRFKFLPSDDMHPPVTDYIPGTISSPKPYEVVIRERN